MSIVSPHFCTVLIRPAVRTGFYWQLGNVWANWKRWAFGWILPACIPHGKFITLILVWFYVGLTEGFVGTLQQQRHNFGVNHQLVAIRTDEQPTLNTQGWGSTSDSSGWGIGLGFIAQTIIYPPPPHNNVSMDSSLTAIVKFQLLNSELSYLKQLSK